MGVRVGKGVAVRVGRSVQVGVGVTVAVGVRLGISVAVLPGLAVDCGVLDGAQEASKTSASRAAASRPIKDEKGISGVRMAMKQLYTKRDRH